MIETFCSCGGPVHAHESAAGSVVPCAGCGQTVRLVTAEPIAPGAALGDFDARLVVCAGPNGRGETIALGGVPDLEVGKSEQKHLRLAGTMVSRSHARLVRLDFGPSRWKVVDTASTNGIFINGQRVAEAELNDGDLLRVGEYEMQFVTAVPIPKPLPAPPPPVGGVACPSCGVGYSKNTKVCVGCGIYVKSGRPLVISRGLDEDELAARADVWIRAVSWVFSFGLFPIASEAFATKRPRTIWWIAGITVLASLFFFVPYYANDVGAMRPWMMWCGDGHKTIEIDGEAFELGGEFHVYQLITNTLIHAGITHLAGNMVFLLVFGIRVNELVGNVKMAIIYPILGISASLIFYASTMYGPPVPSLGASGAIMGLAGMYIVFFPLQKVVMAIWLRISPLFLLSALWRWRCWYKVFRMSGVWLLVFWVGLNDVLPTLLAHARGGETHDGVAHWAHLGGFMTGAAIAVGLLVTRQVDARGSDLLSVALGSKAWPILGTPAQRAAA